MFIVTKIRRGRLAACCLLLALTLGVLAAGGFLAQDVQVASAAAQAQSRPDPAGRKDNESRIAYLESWGWLVGKEAVAVEEILIPETFDASYNDYLALQAAQGFDLTQYAGQTVKRYTYQVLNYPGLQENIWASLLICKKTVIGGQVYCSQGDGFTQGLAYPMDSARHDAQPRDTGVGGGK